MYVKQYQGELIEDVIIALYGVVSALLSPGVSESNEALDRLARETLRHMNEAYHRVKGNRPNGTPMTWDDAKLLVAAHLRKCLHILETSPSAT